MKVVTIPAYSYVNGVSYRADISLLTDNALIAYVKNTWGSGMTQIWSQSGGDYNIANIVNGLLHDMVFNSSWKMYGLYNDDSLVPYTSAEYISYWSFLNNRLNNVIQPIKIGNDYTIGSAEDITPSSTVTLNNYNINRDFGVATKGTFKDYTGNYPLLASIFRNNIEFNILPEGLFDDGTLADRENCPNGYVHVQIIISKDAQAPLTEKFDSVIVRVTYTEDTGYWPTLHATFGDFNTSGSGIYTKSYDEDNPYGLPGNSDTGGADGAFGGIDDIDPAEVPALPSVSAANLGFITIYNPSVTQLRNLADFMWSNLFDLNTYKKLFSDPMQSIIGLAIVPVAPSIAGSKNVMFGTIDSGINMSYLSTNWVQFDCGSVSLEKYVGCFMDYAPYTKISIYLPFIGIRQLSADDVIGDNIRVVYNIDVLTGACAAFIEHSERGVLYTYNGSCITNVPLTSQNFSGAIQNAVSAVISGIGAVAGMTTGAAPLTAAGLTGLLNTAANTALNSKPQIQRSGNLGGSAGIMSIMKPYVIIERPNLAVPYEVQKYVGQACNITYKLGDLSGFTVCEYVHIENCSATTSEKTEIETLLKQGVIL